MRVIRAFVNPWRHGVLLKSESPNGNKELIKNKKITKPNWSAEYNN